MKNGSKLWENDQIAFVVTGLDTPTQNRKTGPMLQSWIIPKEKSPSEAIKTKTDDVVCGNCPLRGDKNGKGRACYVVPFMGPDGVWRSLNKYNGDKEKINGSTFRFGSWGDPAFVPYKVCEGIAKKVKNHTGYSHQWRDKTKQKFKNLLMASVESPESKKEANKMGWRTFRVTSDISTKTKDEVICPASPESGKSNVTCYDCRLCNGNWSGKKKNVVILAHGSKATLSNINKLVK